MSEQMMPITSGSAEPIAHPSPDFPDGARVRFYAGPKVGDLEGVVVETLDAHSISVRLDNGSTMRAMTGSTRLAV